MKNFYVDKNKKTNQILFADVVEEVNLIIPGTCYAEREYAMLLNWKDTKGKTSAEIWWDDIRGKTEFKKYLSEIMKEIEGEKDG
jgi:hypothetical protein